MKKLLLSIKFSLFLILCNAQQISIPRIEQMPNMPVPYIMRDWRQVAIDYDNLLFDTSKTGAYWPITSVHISSGVNYSDIQNIRMDSYVGQNNHGNVAEAINIIPAIVGASLVGVDKSTHLNINWVQKVKDFYNRKNGQNIYLNNYTSSTGNDWWYEIMPNLFFYQLYALYPDSEPDFQNQFKIIADKFLNVLFRLGAKVQPWEAPSMNYRSFDLLTELPNTKGVPEPESAGSIAWILHQAYEQTKEKKYLQGAELALDFLQTFESNPSYEIQLPYGIITAARMNAEEGTNYDINKMLNWSFSSGKRTLRGWGTIIGKWGGYDVSGLIGEANDAGNDYAFVMNGFQHVAALAPVVKYDKRYARSIAKWILNLANASRLFYKNGLPDPNQHQFSNSWASQYDSKHCIPFEAMKQIENEKSPFATGDAVSGGWAATNLSIYSGSSVGYLASVINKTNIEGILQIDLNKTDFRGENGYPTFLYYNPTTSEQFVNITLPTGLHDIYDAISETVLKTNVSGNVSFSIGADATRILVVIPPEKETQTDGRIRKIREGGVIDYHYGYNYTNPLRIKAFSSDKNATTHSKSVLFNCLVENASVPTYKWFQNGTLIHNENSSVLNWVAPAMDGVYKIKCEVSADYKTVISPEIEIAVTSQDETAPKITTFTLSGNDPHNNSEEIFVQATITPIASSFRWQCNGGELVNSSTLTPSWKLPNISGIYSLTLSATNSLGTTTETKKVIVKNMNPESIQDTPVVYYSLNGDTKNVVQDDLHAFSKNAVLVSDQRGLPRSAYGFFDRSQYIYIPNDIRLNFTNKLTVSFWVKPEYFPNYEQFVLSHGSYEERYKMSITPERRMRWTLKTANGIADVDDDMPLQVGMFVHYTGVYTGYSLELYRDGILAGYKPLNGTIGLSSKSITLARKDETETNYNFRGTIDELRIYNNDLSPAYIRKLPSLWELYVGINNQKYNSLLRVSPNPFTSSFFVDLPENAELSTLELFNLQGERIWQKSNICSGEAITPDIKINKGIYLLLLKTTTGKQYLSKIIRE